MLAVNLARLGRPDEARQFDNKVLEIAPSFTVSKWKEVTVEQEPFRGCFLEGLRLAGFPE
jgi:hypothetical protein